MQVVLTLVPGGQALATTLGFTAASVICDNYTSNYLTLPDAGKTIPPWTYGAVVPLPDGIRQANATLTPTVPAVAGPPVPIIQASLTWTDQVLPADPGHLLQQSQYGQQTLVANIAGAANHTIGPKTFAVPAGTQSIGFLVREDGSNAIPQSLTIQGTQSRQNYVLTTTFSTTSGVQWFNFSSASDSSVDVTLITNVLNPSSVDVLASPLVMAPDVVVAVGNVLPVELTDGSGNPIAIDNPSAGVRSVGVSLFDATPAPWQASTNSASQNTSINAGATATFIAASGSTKTYMHGYAYGTDGANAAGRITVKESVSGTVRLDLDANATRGQIAVGTLSGTPTAASNGLSITNGGGAASFIAANQAFTQA